MKQACAVFWVVEVFLVCLFWRGGGVWGGGLVCFFYGMGGKSKGKQRRK